MTVMQINDVWLPDDRPLTVDDLALLPDDGNRYELVDGVLEVTAPPFGIHDRATSRLTILLGGDCPREYEVIIGLGIVFTVRTHYRVPDLAVIRADLFDPEYQTKPPVLAVEVASPSTALRDRNTKLHEYERFGIHSYWIIVPDPDEPSITAHELQDGSYALAAHVTGDEVFWTQRPFPFAVSPRQLITNGEWRAPR